MIFQLLLRWNGAIRYFRNPLSSVNLLLVSKLCDYPLKSDPCLNRWPQTSHHFQHCHPSQDQPRMWVLTSVLICTLETMMPGERAIFDSLLIGLETNWHRGVVVLWLPKWTAADFPNPHRVLMNPFLVQVHILFRVLEDGNRCRPRPCRSRPTLLIGYVVKMGTLCLWPQFPAEDHLALNLKVNGFTICTDFSNPTSGLIPRILTLLYRSILGFFMAIAFVEMSGHETFGSFSQLIRGENNLPVFGVTFLMLTSQCSLEWFHRPLQPVCMLGIWHMSYCIKGPKVSQLAWFLAFSDRPQEMPSSIPRKSCLTKFLCRLWFPLCLRPCNVYLEIVKGL